MFLSGVLTVGWRVVMPLVKLYYRIRYNCKFEGGVFMSYLSRLEGNNYIGRNTFIPGTIMGYGSYVSNNSYFFHVKIGKYSCIGPRTAVICGKHPINLFVSVHPFFYRSKKDGFSYVSETIFDEYKYADEKTKTSVIIGNDVWIGADSKIMEGVKIGDGAVVAAGALVLKDVEPYSIVAGIPARVIGHRFKPEEIEFLLKIKWWDKPQIWIRNNAHLFVNIETFMNYYKE